MKKGKNKSNFLLYVLITVVILCAVAFGAYAYGTSNPSAFGHSVEEIAPPTGCAAGQFLKWTGSAWSCG